jgi:ABC-type lipoprotein export system ATPase subunit
MSNLSDVLGKPNKKHSSKAKGKGKKKSAEPPQKGKKNHRAFGVTNIVSAKRILQRNLDKQQQKEVVPLTNREETIPPPTLIVVMGPKGVGKTTLIRSLVKIYTGQNMTDCNGPITVIAGQKKRLTFFECPLDLYSMTDLAKIADLVILMIDASYGLEMETFEFLNLLQLHGFPKVCGILTNLDKFRNMKTLQKTKKEIKHRFWTEIFKGAKLFELMGVINNKYRKHEVKRLSLYISRIKFRPLVWRNTHPYLLIDRIEDVTPAVTVAGGNGASSALVKKKNGGKGGRSFKNNDDNDDEEEEDEDLTTSSLSLNKGEKEVTLYGYIRGSHLKTTTKVHLLGCGDFDISSITALPDPCPLKHDEGSREGAKLKLSRKKDHLLYAPMANVGRVTIDQTGDLYIDLKHIHYSKKDQLDIVGTESPHSDVAAVATNGRSLEDLLSRFQQFKVSSDSGVGIIGGNPCGNYDFYSKNISLLTAWVEMIRSDSLCCYEEKLNSLQILYNLTLHRFDEKMMNLLVDVGCVPTLINALSCDLMSNGGNSIMRPALPFVRQHSQFDDDEQRKQVFQKYLLLTLCNFANCSVALMNILTTEASGSLGRWSFLAYLTMMSSTSADRRDGKKTDIACDSFTFLQTIPVQENCRLLLSKLLRMKDRNTIQSIRRVVTFEEALFAKEAADEDDDYCFVSQATRERQYSLSTVVVEC